MEPLEIEGKTYITTKNASAITGYESDYIGQLVRTEKVPAKRVGKVWYVDSLALKAYLAARGPIKRGRKKKITTPALIKEERLQEARQDLLGPKQQGVGTVAIRQSETSAPISLPVLEPLPDPLEQGEDEVVSREEIPSPSVASEPATGFKIPVRVIDTAPNQSRKADFVEPSYPRAIMDDLPLLPRIDNRTEDENNSRIPVVAPVTGLAARAQLSMTPTKMAMAGVGGKIVGSILGISMLLLALLNYQNVAEVALRGEAILAKAHAELTPVVSEQVGGVYEGISNGTSNLLASSQLNPWARTVHATIDSWVLEVLDTYQGLLPAI